MHPVFLSSIFMRYEEEILCYTKTCYDLRTSRSLYFNSPATWNYSYLTPKIQIEAFGNLSKFLAIMATGLLDSVPDLTFFVSIVARLRSEAYGFRIPAEARNSTYLFPTTVRLVLGLTQPPFQWVPWDLP